MTVDNRWQGEFVHLVFPPLARQTVGRKGASFSWVEFQLDQGEECYLEIFEDPKWAAKYGAFDELTVNVSPMALRTEAGPVGLLMWHLLNHGTSLVNYEHFIDPTGDEIQKRMESLQAQTRFKVVLRDNRSGEVMGFWELDNVFSSSLKEFVEECTQAFKGLACGSLEDRIAAALREYTPEDLLGPHWKG